MIDIISDMERKSSLGSYLKSLRNAKGMSLRDVEQKTGISNAFLSQIESGKVKEPSPVMLHKMSSLYGVPYETLMERAGYPVPHGKMFVSPPASSTYHRFGTITEEEEQALLDYLSFFRQQAKRQGGRGK